MSQFQLEKNLRRSVHAQKKEWIARKAEVEKKRKAELEKAAAVFPENEASPIPPAANENATSLDEAITSSITHQSNVTT